MTGLVAARARIGAAFYGSSAYRLWEPALVFIFTRAGLFLLAYLAQVLITRQVLTGSFVGEPYLHFWTRWDSFWYLGIAEHGYWPSTSAGPQNLAFFPLYPLMIRGFGFLLGDNELAGLLIANVCFALALVALYRLVEDHFGRQVARWTIVLLSISPFAYFFSAAYTESLFLLLTVSSFMAAERRRWWLAGGLGMLCALTRLVGAAMGPALLLMYLQTRSGRWWKVDRQIVAAGLAPLGTLVYIAYQYLAFGDPMLFYRISIAEWERYQLQTRGLGPLNPFTMLPGDYYLVLAISLVAAVLTLIAVVPVARRMGLAYAAFVFLGAAIPLSAGLQSLGRYVTVLFPTFVVLGLYVRNPLLRNLLAVGFSLLLGLCTLLFINWYAVN
jgi:hypothetical protein